MGLFDRLTRKTVEAHILGLDGYRVEQWTIGKQIQADVVKRKADGGRLYVSIHLEEGEPQVLVMAKSVWDGLKADLDAV